MNYAKIRKYDTSNWDGVSIYRRIDMQEIFTMCIMYLGIILLLITTVLLTK